MVRQKFNEVKETQNFSKEAEILYKKHNGVISRDQFDSFIESIKGYLKFYSDDCITIMVDTKELRCYDPQYSPGKMPNLRITYEPPPN